MSISLWQSALVIRQLLRRKVIAVISFGQSSLVICLVLSVLVKHVLRMVRICGVTDLKAYRQLLWSSIA